MAKSQRRIRAAAKARRKPALPPTLTLNRSDPYRVTTRDGRVLTRGDALQLGDETWTFYGCTHPRKVEAWKLDADADSGKWWMAYYANVWDVEITHVETGEVTFPLTTIRSAEYMHQVGK